MNYYIIYKSALYNKCECCGQQIVDFRQIQQTNPYTLREDVDGKRVVISWKPLWEGHPEPDFINALGQEGDNAVLGPYTHEQIKEIMSYPMWAGEPEEEYTMQEEE